jgi:molybdate transport system ATP-binding protein
VIKAMINARKGEFVVDAEFEVPAKAVTALIGPSGSGKTTILRTIAGLEKHPGSSVAVFGESWQDEDSFLPPHKRRIGYVFQEPSLFPHLTVRGNIAYAIKRDSAKELDAKVYRAASRLGIEHLLDRYPQSLSGGEGQRVAVARSIAVNRSVLLMDEPVSSLDAALKNEVLSYIEKVHKELRITVIYVSHSADEVARLADHVVLLESGRVKGSGPIAEILTRFDLPLASGPDAEAVIKASVSAHDDEFDLTLLEFSGGKFNVPRIAAETGDEVRLRVLARDVSLTLEEQHGTSILNIFPAVVRETAPAGDSQITVLLDCGGAPLLARVTRKSASILGLEPGKRVFAQAKSVAVLSQG